MAVPVPDGWTRRNRERERSASQTGEGGSKGLVSGHGQVWQDEMAVYKASLQASHWVVERSKRERGRERSQWSRGGKKVAESRMNGQERGSLEDNLSDTMASPLTLTSLAGVASRSENGSPGRSERRERLGDVCGLLKRHTVGLPDRLFQIVRHAVGKLVGG